MRIPALITGFSIALGSAIALTPSFSLALVALLFLFTIRKWQYILVIGVASLLCFVRQPPPPATYSGTGTFKVHSAKPHELPFRNALVVRGTFDGHPCSIFFPKGAKPPLDGSYRVQGRLNGTIFRPAKKTTWEKIPYTYSLAGFRYRTKQKIYAHLTHYIQPKETADFLSAIITGDIENRFVKFHFSRLGLQHILAISGLHFGIIALLLGFILRRLLPSTKATLTLLTILTAYAILLGDTPSVMRAYLMITVYLAGTLLGRKTTPLNAVGVALCIELLYDPTHITHIGCLLSYSATLAILLFTRPVENLLTLLLPKRSAIELEQMPLFDKHGYALLQPLRKALSLNFSVFLLTSPIILSTFGNLPLLSLLYNLFYPFLITGSIALLLLGLHPINAWYTTYILDIVRYAPPSWRLTLHFDHFHPDLALLLVTLPFLYLTKQQLQIK